ncbi:MAG: hypothetical protein ACREVB_15895, partial [Burkholderiales bacterium]
SEVAGVIRRGDNERVFLISQDSERELTLTLGLSAWAQMIAGPALTVFGLGYWLLALARRAQFPG